MQFVTNQPCRVTSWRYPPRFLRLRKNITFTDLVEDGEHRIIYGRVGNPENHALFTVEIGTYECSGLEPIVSIKYRVAGSTSIVHLQVANCICHIMNDSSAWVMPSTFSAYIIGIIIHQRCVARTHVPLSVYANRVDTYMSGVAFWC